MNIAHLKPGAVSGESPGTQGRKPTFVSQLRQRIGLVHKLREAGTAKELPYSSNHCTVVNQSVRGSRSGSQKTHSFLDRSLHTKQPHPEMALQEFPYCSYTPIAQMIYVIRGIQAIINQDETTHNGHQVLRGERLVCERAVKAKSLI